jgi:hypothetical protein
LCRFPAVELRANQFTHDSTYRPALSERINMSPLLLTYNKLQRARPIRFLGATLLVVIGLLLILLSLSAPARADADFAIRTPFGDDDDETEAVVAGDIDGDGALDLIAGNPGQQSAVYLNDGAGNFPAGSVTCASAGVRCFGGAYDPTTSVAVGDVNGDGALDIIAGNPGAPSMIYLNNGTGYFNYDFWMTCDAVGVRCFGGPDDNVTSVAVGDVNGDGKLDVVVANNGGQSMAFLNNGAGEFASGPVICGVTSNVRCFGGSTDPIYTVALGDMNDDSALDIVAGSGLATGDINRFGTMTGAQSAVYLNDGAGNFASALNCGNAAAVRCFGGPSDKTASVALGDLDGNGTLDIAAGAQGSGDQSAVYLNNGGNFAALQDCMNTAAVRCFGQGALSVAVGDNNGDGALDIAAGLYGQSAVYLNDGTGVFAYGFTDCGSTARVRCFSGVLSLTSSVVLADVNGDRGLDVVAGNNQWNTGQNAIYLNETGGGDFAADMLCGVTPGVNCFGAGASNIWSVAAGDVNGDGALDLVAGNQTGMSAVYLNDGAGHFKSGTLDCTQVARVRCFGPSDDFVDPSIGAGPTVAVGDFNGDGALDIAVASELSQLDLPSAVYLNDGTGHFVYGPGVTCATPGMRCFSPEQDTATDIAVGDMNSDGALDLIVTRAPYTITAVSSAVYLNDGAGNFTSETVSCGVTVGVRCFGHPYDSAFSVAVGDFNRDGALDIASGRSAGPSIIYLNDGNGNFVMTAYPGDCGSTPYVRCFGGANYNANSVMAGDVNSDGTLDIVMVNNGLPAAAYLNGGAGNFHVGPASCGIAEDVRCFGPGNNETYALELGDLNGDGMLDVVVGNYDTQNSAYLNNAAGRFYFGPVTCGVTARVRCFGYRAQDVAVGDFNGDGALDIVTANNGLESGVYLNGLSRAGRLVNNPPQVALNALNPLVNANFVYTNPTLRVPTMSITYTLSDPESDAVRFIRAYYSPDGGGQWLPAVTANGAVTTNLATSENGLAHSFTWDIFSSGFFGQSDNVVLRLEAYASLSPTLKDAPGPYQHPYASATTFPFRVRGTQVRVLAAAPGGTQPISNAIVYRLPKGQTTGSRPIADGGGNPFRTDDQGYLQGRGQIGIGDQLVALYPISSTGTYTLYYTSATPMTTGVNAHTVLTPGVQTLVVSPSNPLILFDLDVSLEWDARQDTNTLDRLQYDLQRASELLYDWTDGQAALGHINIYQAGEHWSDANVRILANNRLRPNASQGGIVSTTLSEVITTSLTSTQVITYEPGQIRMAVNWNRFGDPGGTLGDDWARAFAHELGHYLFFQDDNYLGYDAAGNFVAVPTCPGAMNDPYSGDKASGYDELHPITNWPAQCANTLANRETNRSDWQTIERFYPALNETLATTPDKFGPSNLPLAVTQMEVQPVASGFLAVPLVSPIYSLVRAEGGSYAPERASAYLFQDTDQDQVPDRLIELGTPVSGKVEARGARAGDRLCVFDPEARRLGCSVLNDVNRTLALTSRPDWSPSVLVTPVTSRTIQVTVSGVTQTVSMAAQLFPRDSAASAVILLNQTQVGADMYQGTFVLETEALEASVHVWVNEPGARRETLTSYSIGGNPAPRKPGKSGRSQPPRRFKRAPVLSSDGQAQVLGIQGNFPLGEFYALQNVDNFPAPPIWTTVVGQAYRLVRSSGAPSLAGSAFTVNYLDSEVPAGEESSLTIYFLASCGSSGAGLPPAAGPYRIYLPLVMRGGAQTCTPTWRALPTTRDADGDLVSAATQGEGLYLVLSSIDMPLHQGWNDVAYPVAESRPVTVGLASITGKYTSVCSYQADDVDNPWHCFGSGLPPFGDAWVNDLTTLEFGTYWIYATQAVTLSLKGPYGGALVNQPVYSEPPPAVFYGEVKSSSMFAVKPGMIVAARMGEAVCGQTKTIEVEGLTRYVIDVRAVARKGNTACGRAGGAITFAIDGLALMPSTTWDNAQMRELDLRP